MRIPKSVKTILQELGIPVVIMYLLIAVVAIIKLPLRTIITPAVTPQTSKRYTILLNRSEIKNWEYGLVTSVADGDTLQINEKDTIRLLAIDTPELEHKQSKIKLECFAKDAKKRLEQLTLGKYIYLQKGPRNKDKYGRLLRFVFVPDETHTDPNNISLFFANAYLVGEGYARLYILEPKLVYAEEFKSLEAKARTEMKGLWGLCDRDKFRW